MASACTLAPRSLPERGVAAVDAADRPITELQAGSTLHVAARGLPPLQLFELRVALGAAPAPTTDAALSFARTGTDARGEIAATALWYHSGVVGSSLRRPAQNLPRGMFRTFEDAEGAFAGRDLTISIHPVQADPSGRLPPMGLEVGKPVFVQHLPFARRRDPMLFPSDAAGLLRNSIEVGTEDLYAAGRDFAPGQALLVSVVPNQRRWFVGDDVRDVTGPGGVPEPVLVTTDAKGRFVARVWEAARHRRGSYDLIAQPIDRSLEQSASRSKLLPRDIVSYAADTAVLLFLRYPVGGPTMDIAGRPISGSPYFQFADSFAQFGDTVWGAVDPTYVPATHPGGHWAAYYVVAHRDVNGWDPTAGGSNALVDVSGGIEIHPVKAGCVNGTDTPIWYPPLVPGQYDVVVEFGPTPAEDATSYATDATYDPPTDFLDGADQIGFVVATDPYELGSFPIGEAEYSVDDFFPTLGTASNVDLRAVVRYPGAAAGPGAAVAAGTFPLFVIEHGNHRNCEDAGGPLCSHATCVNRTLNHEGYMRLLDILASHGVIAVSIDAYDLTGPNSCISAWIEERGDLILKHIELWSHLNTPAAFPGYPDPFAGRFTGKVDLTKVSVSGHSRGGEASVAAFQRNTQGFAINSVSSIAPVDFVQYTLPSVPYFVILPAGDGDVSNLAGQRIYDRAGSTVGDATTKSGLYVYGANHNFFNTVWADDNDDSPASRPDYIAAADQQRLGEAYLAAFALVHLRGETVYEDMLRGQLVFPSTSGFKAFPIHHELAHLKIENGSGAGAAASGSATLLAGAAPGPHLTQALRMAWSNSTGVVEYTGGPWDASAFEVLSFRVTQSDSAVNPAGDQDFVVELVGGGKTKAVYASRHGRIPKPYLHPYGLTHNVMTTVRMPLHSFIMNKSGVTLDAIDTIRFRFTGPAQGEIHVDDIEFSR
ncbi:MAG: hypothetical protein U1E73_11885 [Planctomycetota bacterium]